MLNIMEAVKQRIDECGLIKGFEKNFWNFYEWSEYSDGRGDIDNYHLILNCAYVYSVERFQEICPEFTLDTEKIKKAIVKHFYNEETGLFFVSLKERDKYSQLGNAFALLIGLGNQETVKALKQI